MAGKRMPSEASTLAQEPMPWFQHDANAASDIRCERLLLRYGNAGYGAYWRLCEKLAATKGHALPVATDEDWLILATALGFRTGGAFDEVQAVGECQGFVESLIEIGLVERTKNDLIQSNRMQKNALYFGTQKANGRRGGRPRKKTAESK